jgi:hypothetical protein
MKYTKIKLVSVALGDTIACVAAVEHYRHSKQLEQIQFDCAEWLWQYLAPAYPNILFTHIDDPQLNLYYFFDMPVQAGFAYQLYEIPVEKKDFVWDFIDPKIHYNIQTRPIQNKYITFSIHSTAQVKYWNSGKRHEQLKSTRWFELCALLRKVNVTPVFVDKYYGFGQEPNWNEPPKNAVHKIGLPFDEVLNLIHHSEFYIGLSSGLSWVAKAMGKNTVMIAPFAEPENEFGKTNDNHIRVESKSLCRHCWTDCGTKFNAGDWYWCPKHQNTEMEFSCSAEITAEQVLKCIFDKNWIYRI